MNFADGTWLNPPPQASVSADRVTLTTGDKTDFWQSTLYGFRRDDGHFLALPAPETFDAQLTFEAGFEQLYDQAGIMLRIDARTWIKAGIEFSDEVLNFSAVVTREGRSDWAVQQLPPAPGPFTIRLIRVGAAVIVHRRHSDGWRLLRLADFPTGPGQIGPMACTPERAGLQVTFRDFQMGTPPDEPLHLTED